MNKKINERYKNSILSLIKSFLPESKVYLFGSRAKQTHHETSDIDLAVDNKKVIDKRLLIQLKNAIDALNIPYTIDIVDLNNVQDSLKKEIEKDKIIWN